jgi:hypothetical protein
MAVYWIDFKRLEVYEAGAMLVTRLAFPCEGESEETLSRVHASLCAYALRARCQIEPDWGTSPQRIKPIYALREQCDVDRDLRTLERRLRDRMVAGRMAIGFLKEALTGQEPLPTGLKRLSINQMSEFVLDDTGYTDPENVETRIWRQSLPVIHLCSAIQVMLQLVEEQTGSLGLETLLLGHHAIECVVRAAEFHESVVAQSRHLRIDDERLVKFRLGERR